MADILHDFPIRASPARVFEVMVTPQGLDQWWTLRATGRPESDSEYQLWFGPEYDWRARVTRLVTSEEFEWEMTRATDDWLGTRVGFRLTQEVGQTLVSFRHTGWAGPTPHFRTSSCCWAMYLRILRRYIEHNETVAYDKRLDV